MTCTTDTNYLCNADEKSILRVSTTPATTTELIFDTDPDNIRAETVWLSLEQCQELINQLVTHIERNTP